MNCINHGFFALDAPCPRCKDETDLTRYREAIIWALGAGEDFPQRPAGAGAYWWRSELQKRAGLKWDGEKFIQA